MERLSLLGLGLVEGFLALASALLIFGGRGQEDFGILFACGYLNTFGHLFTCQLIHLAVRRSMGVRPHPRTLTTVLLWTRTLRGLGLLFTLFTYGRLESPGLMNSYLVCLVPELGFLLLAWVQGSST